MVAAHLDITHQRSLIAVPYSAATVALQCPNEDMVGWNGMARRPHLARRGESLER